MPHLCSPRAACLLLTAVLIPAVTVAQTQPADPGTAPGTAGAAATSATPPLPNATPSAPESAQPNHAQQAVLDRIRFLRDGDQRRFGSCSYRWDRWKLQADGSRITTYSCEGGPSAERTVSVHCGKLQMNSYDPLPAASGKGESWAWGSWRLPQPGAEEKMVASLCANALPMPPAPAKPATVAAPAAKTTTPR